MNYLYVAPFFAYLIGTSVAAKFEGVSYSVAYGVLMVGITGLFLCLAATARPKAKTAGDDRHSSVGLSEIAPHWRVAEGFLVGVIGIALWIWLSDLQLERRFLPEMLQPAERVSFNPLSEFDSSWGKWAFVAVRLFGLAIVVPVAEELFWRGFLLRWIIDPNWEQVPLGSFTWRSCLAVTALFTLAHPEWLAAAVYCLLINGLLYWRRDLWQCVVAHGVSNLLLGLYVLKYEVWYLW
ncbi:MAG TPA: CAAX prenyl protease-related protein [Planctomycetaceae bacterium]|nr:CAAX prenyl protease-related protein [Planctomycetaceae bacterium]